MAFRTTRLNKLNELACSMSRHEELVTLCTHNMPFFSGFRLVQRSKPSRYPVSISFILQLSRPRFLDVPSNDLTTYSRRESSSLFSVGPIWMYGFPLSCGHPSTLSKNSEGWWICTQSLFRSAQIAFWGLKLSTIRMHTNGHQNKDARVRTMRPLQATAYLTTC